jgi:hypothetical protein
MQGPIVPIAAAYCTYTTAAYCTYCSGLLYLPQWPCVHMWHRFIVPTAVIYFIYCGMQLWGKLSASQLVHIITIGRLLVNRYYPIVLG